MANGAPGGVDPTALTLDGRPRGLVAETAKLDAGADLQDRSSPDIGAGRGHGFARGHNAQGWRPAGMGAAGASSDPAAGYARQHRLAIQADAASLAPVQSAPAAPGPQAAGATVQHAAAAQAAPVRAEAGAADVLSTVLAPALGQASSQTGHHGADPAEGSARTEGATAPEPVPADHAAVVADPNPGPDPVGAEVRLNHQVAYWVRQKTQGAELTVQREGQPVEVSLSLSGNHAHVSFRSDQPHTRELLDQGAAQLRDLLHSEGLVLSGMSVGMSAPEAGADSGAAAPSPHPRSGAHDVPRHQAQVLSMAPVGPAERVRGAGVVDIFV